MLQTRSLNFRTLTSLQKRFYASTKDVLGDIEVEEVPVYDVEPKHSVDDLEIIRNKSRLEPNHRKILHGQAPYEEAREYYHNEVWYRKKVLGTWGMNNPMANPKYCWPTKEEVEDIKEYERVLYPNTIQEVWKQIEEKKIADALTIKQREEEIAKVVANFGKWEAELKAKIAKKEAELLEAKQRKEAVLEEIREHFGFQIDAKDERFQEMLEQKEKEDKKRKKEEKKKKKHERFIMSMNKQMEAAKLKEEQDKLKVASENEHDSAKKVEEEVKNDQENPKDQSNKTD
ncbi:growth arrest and DNA damage-inducible proteins-interacting protein 1 [Copidosoma floridanum]|uniref:growth arrest and DNA damage-inducible proteins-interacting protein 1 n=1 Tax=Copidosoma floridanum TaxID=29053 RepID=UPI0006C99281|nr:growth arrest and DNA damage-inducible proteins-interacting protein 1 [Copidosoma floridanum]